MNSTPAPAARSLARTRKIMNLLVIGLVVSVITNIGIAIYFWNGSHIRDQVVLFDLASGTLLLSPIVDPSDSKEILEISSSWAAKCILDRSPSGLDNDDLVGLLFDAQTGRKVRDEFAGVKQQYFEKNLRSHVEIKSIDAQSIGNGFIKSRVVGQVVITGTVQNQSIQDVQQVTLDLSFVRNPDLGRNKKYPLMCWSYVYASNSVAKK